ncbi:MAG: Crp/Fnr family transcriptional regulator [Azonexaceae bacterium]|nr:Crp/Fnr family transcriptional regulator [Azonexaceae bacterium]
MRDFQPVQVESLLSRIPLFEGLSPDELARMAKGVHEVRLTKGDMLFRHGDACTGFHVLVYGQIKLALSSAQGTDKVVEIIQPGQSFGEAIMFMEKPYFVFAQALSDSLVLHVSRAAIYQELQNDHAFVRKMMAGMAMRMHQLMTDVEAYSLHSGTQRVIHFLMHELPESQWGAENVALELSSNKGVIASRLNLTQEHFSRILHDLSSLGLIIVEGKRIRIPSVPKLQKHQPA